MTLVVKICKKIAKIECPFGYQKGLNLKSGNTINNMLAFDLICMPVSSIYMRVVYKELGKSAKNWGKVVKSEMHLSS